jgi:hypothetical protein
MYFFLVKKVQRRRERERERESEVKEGWKKC